VGDFIRYFFKLQDGRDVMVKLLNDQQAPTFKAGDKASLTWSISDGLALDHP
jgi:putative spermidine/putrescine transport system ATP-binding protein